MAALRYTPRMRLLPALLFLMLPACTSDEPEKYDTGQPVVDDDLDGYTVQEGDCNDQDAAFNPGVSEICDSLDNNCDGTIDEGVQQSWWADRDGDGFGDPDGAETGCTPPSDSTGNDRDCDDDDRDVYPGAREVCDDRDNDCDGDTDEEGSTTFYADRDGDGYGDADATTLACSLPDGYAAVNTDCDDARADSYPGAPETCNGIDDDCDGTADEEPTDAPLWYLDGDGDGWAGDRLSLAACEQPAGYLPAAEDCDDADAAVNPGGAEVCNGVDDDCDGAIDDGATDLQTWYADADGDGFGDPDATARSCSPPAGHVADATDCDDADAGVFPGAAEVCDSTDNDCDGLADDADPGVSGQATWYADADADGWGDAAVDTDACDAPAGYVAANTDCDDSDPGVSPAGIDACDGIDNDCSGLIDDGGLCPCDVFYDSGRTYLFCTALQTWSDARSQCQQYGYDLATINDAAEDDALRAEALSYGNTAAWHWWVGYTDALVESSFGWAGGNGNSYNNWNSNEPNNLYNNEDCVVFAFEGGRWNDWTCSNTTTSVCERF